MNGTATSIPAFTRTLFTPPLHRHHLGSQRNGDRTHETWPSFWPQVFGAVQVDCTTAQPSPGLSNQAAAASGYLYWWTGTACLVPAPSPHHARPCPHPKMPAPAPRPPQQCSVRQARSHAVAQPQMQNRRPPHTLGCAGGGDHSGLLCSVTNRCKGSMLGANKRAE